MAHIIHIYLPIGEHGKEKPKLLGHPVVLQLPFSLPVTFLDIPGREKGWLFIL